MSYITLTKKNEAEQFRQATIEVYNAWTIWAEKKGAGLIYSTFVNEFGVDSVLTELGYGDLVNKKRLIHDTILEIDFYLRKYVNSYFGIQ